MVKRSLFLSSKLRFLFAFFLPDINLSRKVLGAYLYSTECINCSLACFCRRLYGRICSSWKSGSEGCLLFELVMILMAFFWIFKILFAFDFDIDERGPIQ